MTTEKSHIHAILLAAGTSKRFGKDNKLLTKMRGGLLVHKTASALLSSRADEVVVVLGHEASKVGAALSDLDVRRAFNADYEEGMASSIRSGINALPADARGCIIALADMPGVTARLVDRLIAAFEKAGGQVIVYPEDADGKQGNPVLWPRRYFPELAALEGEKGAKALLGTYTDACVTVPVKGDAAFRDIDRPGDLEPAKKEPKS